MPSLRSGIDFVIVHPSCENDMKGNIITPSLCMIPVHFPLSHGAYGKGRGWRGGAPFSFCSGDEEEVLGSKVAEKGKSLYI